MKPRRSPLVSFEVESNHGYTDMDGASQYRNFPVRVSIPLAPKVCAANDTLELLDANKRPVPLFSRPFVLWPDGSVRAWELSFPVSVARGKKYRFQLFRGGNSTATRIKQLFLQTPASFTISTRLANGARLRQAVQFANTSNATGYREDEKEVSLATGKQKPLFRGALVRKSFGWHPGIELEVRLINYGKDDTLNVRGVRLEFDLPGRGRLRYCVRQSCFTAWGHPRLVERRNSFRVRADHEGIHVTDPAQLGEVESKYPPYERGAYLCSVQPWVGLADDEAGWALVIPDAAERQPKAWRIEGRKVIVELHPEHSPALEWRQGMAIFQRIYLARLASDATPAEFENEAQSWLRQPIVRIDPEVYRNAGWRIPFRYKPERFPKTEFAFRDSFSFNWTPGTFHWGDQVAGGKGGGSVSPGNKGVARNLEYDFVAVAAKEYARTGFANILKHCRASAEHSMYTDFVTVSNDPWKEGGIPHHCPDHTSGAAYPSHMWAEGLTLYYQLTGDRYALHVARRVGDFYLKYIRERFVAVQATAREVGWTLIALSAIYDLTREQRYLDGIRRVVDYNLEQGWRKFFPTDATFTIGIGIIGFNRSREFYRDKETRKFIFELLEWMMKDRRDEIGLFEYWRNPEAGAIAYVQSHLPEALNIGYNLSGNEGYLRAAFRLYQIHLGGGLLTVQNRYGPPECGFAAGNHISWMGCLQSFAEKGWLDALQYPEPN